MKEVWKNYISEIIEIFKSPYHLSFQAAPYFLEDPIKMKKKKIQCMPVIWKAA